ncbi:helix-turn-helix domain-containing protein [Actinoplanes bogorensis]|uniref:Helix-turn-helix domain-containing protein n=1 Tax=Paractinoplanes bogorensis TaxID=1610840 RepID=A0ABS5YHS4_9ACTN|nr:helix-turn-helix domain-containing protein [Actinoplanes bogorensis]MBU2662571.1 helix-turn-helix domain-containing protein [Actinoplanes bogorensis]
MTGKETPPGRSVLDGAFRLLQALPEAGLEGQVGRLVRLTGLPRPTVHRLLGQLAEVGAVRHVGDYWVLSSDLMMLARRVEPYAGLRDAATGVLRVLRAQTGATVSLIVPQSESFVLLESVPGQLSIPVDMRAGTSLPGFTAAGRLLTPGTTTAPRGAGGGIATDHPHKGFSCYAVPVALPGGGSAALQVAFAGPEPASRFAVPMGRAAHALARQLVR